MLIWPRYEVCSNLKNTYVIPTDCWADLDLLRCMASREKQCEFKLLKSLKLMSLISLTILNCFFRIDVRYGPMPMSLVTIRVSVQVKGYFFSKSLASLFVIADLQLNDFIQGGYFICFLQSISNLKSRDCDFILSTQAMCTQDHECQEKVVNFLKYFFNFLIASCRCLFANKFKRNWYLQVG